MFDELDVALMRRLIDRENRRQRIADEKRDVEKRLDREKRIRTYCERADKEEPLFFT